MHNSRQRCFNSSSPHTTLFTHQHSKKAGWGSASNARQHTEQHARHSSIHSALVCWSRCRNRSADSSSAESVLSRSHRNESHICGMHVMHWTAGGTEHDPAHLQDWVLMRCCDSTNTNTRVAQNTGCYSPAAAMRVLHITHVHAPVLVAVCAWHEHVTSALWRLVATVHTYAGGIALEQHLQHSRHGQTGLICRLKPQVTSYPLSADEQLTNRIPENAKPPLVLYYHANGSNSTVGRLGPRLCTGSQVANAAACCRCSISPPSCSKLQAKQHPKHIRPTYPTACQTTVCLLNKHHTAKRNSKSHQAATVQSYDSHAVQLCLQAFKLAHATAGYAHAKYISHHGLHPQERHTHTHSPANPITRQHADLVW